MSVKNKKVYFIIIIIGLLYVACSRTGNQKNGVLPRVSLHTELGEIIVELEIKKAPLTVANFLKYVEEERYVGANFYRVVTPGNQPKDSIRIEVIQGGLGFDESPLQLPAIVHETTKETGVKHKDGVISMARLEPGTASSEFFICVGDQPELDFGGLRNPDGQGFAAFGRVVSGMDVVKKIQNTLSEGQMLINPVRISQVRRLQE